MAQSDSQPAHWFVHYRGQRLGPYLWEQVTKYYSDCGEPEGFLVWTKSQTDWLPMPDVSLVDNVAQPAMDQSTPLVSKVSLTDSSRKTSPSEGGMRVVETDGADFSLKLNLLDKPKIVPNAKAGVQPTREATKNRQSELVKTPAAPLREIRSVKPIEPEIAVKKPTDGEKPEEETTEEGWLNHAKHKEAADSPELEDDHPLTQELNFQPPTVKRSAPIWLTAVLALSCAATFFRHDPGPVLPQPKSAFALRCSYVVETKSGSSFRKRAKVQVSASKFRVDTPQTEHEFAIFDGKNLSLFKSFKRKRSAKKIFRKEVQDHPNPMFLKNLKIWVPQTSGEPEKYSKLAGRSVMELVRKSKAGIRQNSTREWIDAKHGVVLKRVDTTTDRGNLLEKTTFRCTRAKFGPLPAGTFKGPT